jgi:hypothetical protein
MAQWNKNIQDYLNQERTLFEVYARADRYGNIYDDLGQGFSGDLFGRLKVSQPFTLFDSTHRYSQDGDFSDVVLGAGSTVGIITHQSTATLGIGTTAGCSTIRESKRVFSYQPGKSLQVLQTFVMGDPKSNLTQRVGYASSTNGVFLEQQTGAAGVTTSYWVMRTERSGISTEIRVPQSEWNRDTFDGTGFSTSNPSGIALDLTKAQILFTEYEWLGVGAVRCGVVNENGIFHILHIFNHSNVIDSTYMTTATLPVRYEIFNTGITTSSSTMKQICVSIQSNGGYEKRQAMDVARRDTTVSLSQSTSFTPLVSIRLAPGREDAVIIPHEFNVLPDTSAGVTASFEVVLVKNATLTSSNFISTSTSSSNVYVDFAATAMSGGTIIKNDYIVSANKATQPLNVTQEYNWDLQLGRTQAKVSDILTLGIRCISGSGTALGSIGFYDLT